MKKLLLIAVLMSGEALALTQNQATIALAQSHPIKITSTGYLDCEVTEIGDLNKPECSSAYQLNIPESETE